MGEVSSSVDCIALESVAVGVEVVGDEPAVSSPDDKLSALGSRWRQGFSRNEDFMYALGPLSPLCL